MVSSRERNILLEKDDLGKVSLLDSDAFIA